MKTFALIVSFCATLLVSHAAGPMLIKDGKLQSDLNAGGQSITNINGLYDVNGDPITGGSGGGVTGPASSTVNNLAAWNSTIGGALKDSGIPFANVVLQSALNTYSNAIINASQSSINTASNSVVGTMQTSINTTSNSLNGSINVSSNSVYGIALSQINTTSNSVLANAQSAINASSNSLNGTINISSNAALSNAQIAINTSSNALNGTINTSSNLLIGQLGTAAFQPTSAFDSAGAAAQRVSTNAGISFNQRSFSPTNFASDGSRVFDTLGAGGSPGVGVYQTFAFKDSGGTELITMDSSGDFDVFQGDLHVHGGSIIGNGANITALNASQLTSGTVPIAVLNTNVVIVTNQPATPGQAVVIAGTNSTGQLVLKPTNWPSGGATSPTILFPDNTNNLVYEMDAPVLTNTLTDGNVITNWTGAYTSGLTNVGTAANGPPIFKTNILNGLPVARFFGTNRLVSTRTFSTASFGTNITVMIVAKHNLGPSLTVMANINGTQMYLGLTTPDCQVWNANSLSPNTTGKTGYPFLPYTNNTYTVNIQCWSYDGSAFRSGDGLHMRAFQTTGAIPFSDNPLEIGAIGGTFNWSGDIGCIRVYNTADPTIIRQAAAYLAQRWGIDTNPPTNIMITGDSTAQGLGLSAGQDPASIITNLLAGHYSIENRGVGGQTMGGRLAVIDDDTARIIPGGQTINLNLECSNDTINGTNASDMEMSQRIYGSKFRAAGGKYIFSRILPRGGFTTANESNRLAFASITETNWPQYADGYFNNTLLAPTSITNDTRYLQSDKIHPTYIYNQMAAPEEVHLIRKLDVRGDLQ